MRIWIELADMPLFLNDRAAWCVSDYSTDGGSVQVTTDMRPTPFKVLDLTGKFQVPEYVIFHSIHDLTDKSNLNVNVFESGFYELEYVNMGLVHQRLSDCLTVLHYLPELPITQHGDLRIFGTLHPDLYLRYADASAFNRSGKAISIILDITNNVLLLRNALDVDVPSLIEASHNHLKMSHKTTPTNTTANIST